VVGVEAVVAAASAAATGVSTFALTADKDAAKAAADNNFKFIVIPF
jgi:hypothetical protein